MTWREFPLSHGEPKIGGIRPGPDTGHTTPRERDDEERRRRHDEAQDPWGYDEPVDEEPPKDYE